MKSKLNRRRGFTVIEIIVAVVIMAALFTVLVKSLDGAKTRAERSTKQTRIKEDALMYKEEVEQMLEDNFKGKKGADIASYMNKRGDKDPNNENYIFGIQGTTFGLKPGPTAIAAGIHEEILPLKHTAN